MNEKARPETSQTRGGSVTTTPNYCKRIPSAAEIPAGEVLVHSHVRPAVRQGHRGFRYWTAPPDSGLVPCACGWAPGSPMHYLSPIPGRDPIR
jgi:hypothetical protein